MGTVRREKAKCKKMMRFFAALRMTRIRAFRCAVHTLPLSVGYEIIRLVVLNR